MTDRSDLVLIRAARSDAGAFGELYERHVFAIHGWLRRSGLVSARVVYELPVGVVLAGCRVEREP
jgi:hypothetical protein